MEDTYCPACGAPADQPCRVCVPDAPAKAAPPKEWNPFGPDPELDEVVLIGGQRMRFKGRIHDGYRWEAVDSFVVTEQFMDLMVLGRRAR